MSRFFARFLAMLLAVSLSAGRLSALDPAGPADTSKPEAPKASAPLSADEIQTFAKNLDANKFSQREEASTKLFQAGKAAIPALIEAAQSESREASSRALDILKRHIGGDNGDCKTAAKEALETISKGSNETASRLAKDLLAPKPSPGAIAGGQLVPGGIQIGGGQIQIQVQGIAGGPGFQARRMSVKNVNGAKEIESDDGEKKVSIKDDANGIKMEITRKKDGKENTEKFEAKNLDELKKAHPEAAKIYEELDKGNGGIQVQGGAIIIGQGGLIPVRPGAPLPVIPPLPIPLQDDTATKAAKEQIEKVRKIIQDAREQKKNLSEKELQELQTQLEEAAAKLGK